MLESPVGDVAVKGTALHWGKGWVQSYHHWLLLSLDVQMPDGKGAAS